MNFDLLTPFFDIGIGSSSNFASTSATNNGKIFESAQSRFRRLQIPIEEMEWIVCDQCGQVISQKLYQTHLIQHEMMELTLQLYHYEIDQEHKHQHMAERIRRKEEHRQLGLAYSSSNSSTSSSDFSSSSSSPCPSSPSYSNCSSPPPTMEENAMDIPNGAEMKIKNVIVKSRKRKRMKMEPTAMEWTEEKENNSILAKAGGARTFLMKKKEILALTKKAKSSQQKLAAQMKRRRPKRKIIRVKKENDEEGARAAFEHELCLKNLGPKYQHVQVALRGQQKFFDRYGRVSLANLKQITTPKAKKDGPSPSRRRFSLRGGAFRFNFDGGNEAEDGDEMDNELVALI